MAGADGPASAPVWDELAVDGRTALVEPLEPTRAAALNIAQMHAMRSGLALAVSGEAAAIAKSIDAIVEGGKGAARVRAAGVTAIEPRFFARSE
jgi:hypothetical protein